MIKDKTVPLPMEEVFSRMNLSTDFGAIEKRLSDINVKYHVIQDFVPLHKSIEWELSLLHWDNEGLQPFVENNVPFVINNSGRLSLQTALLLFGYCESLSHQNEILLLEMGAGTGLFARYLLDALKDLCDQQDKDYYSRIRYYITDYSKTTIEQWQQRRIFEKHQQRVVLASCDGLKPTKIIHPDGEVEELSSIDAVFCNYMLDILPSTFIKKNGNNGLLELCVRTHLHKNEAALKEYTELSYEDIKATIAHEDLASRKALLPLIDVFEYETEYLSTGNKTKEYESLLEKMHYQDGKVLLNYGAITCLEQCLNVLTQTGFILINDYGPSSQDEMKNFGPAQRFGATVANGLNFPMLNNYFNHSGHRFIAPDGVETAAIQPRLLLTSTDDTLSGYFNNIFGPSASELYERDLNAARQHQTAGRRNEALAAYLAAIKQNQRDWYVIGEIAEYLIMQINDFKAGIEMAQHAINMNPWYSTWLWNVLGDGLFCNEQFREAHEAYLQAERIDRKDPRTNLNLAYSYYQNGNYEKALQAIASGLTYDVRSHFRARLLEKQQQILAAVSGKWLSKQERLWSRCERLN